MRFAVLGTVEARDGARAVDLGPARRVAVLAALLVDAGRPVPTTLLADRVWDGHPPASATATLHAYVSRLRTTLAPAGAPLRTTPAGYLLDVGPDALDATRFTDGVDRARRLAAGTDVAAARAEVGAALALWRGRAYTGVDTEFATAEAARLDDVRLTARELAAELDLRLGRHHPLAAELRPIVAEHPFREGLRASLMLALYRAGRQAEALEVYETGRALLADELGVDPGVRLRTLHTAVLRQDPALLGPVTEPGPAPVRPRAPAGPGRFVGRAAELGVLDALCRDAATGTTRFAAIAGEAGIGKSRLAEEIAGHARDDGFLVAWGRCWRHEGAPALWPWVQVVRELAQACPAPTTTEAFTGRGAALASVLPELDPGGVGRTSSVEQAEVQVFDALLHALGVVCGRSPVLVVIDDAQWADPWSRRMLEYAATHARTQRLAIVVTVRSPADEEGDADLAVLDALVRAARPERLDLNGLGTEDLRRFVLDRVGRDPGPADAAALRTRTDGNPFHAGEIARLVADREATGERTDEVPHGVRGVIRRRLGRLPAADVDVLAVAALLGRTFDTGLLAVVADRDEDVVDDTLDRATAAGLLRTDPGSTTGYRFTHALLQETLVDDAGPSRRRRLHRRVARTLADRGVPEDAERIAHHYALAGSGADLRQAVHHLLAAADSAITRWSLPEVDQLLSTAADVARRLPPDVGDRATVASAVDSRANAFRLLVRGSLPAPPDDREPQAPVPGAGGRDVLAALVGEWGRLYGSGRPAASDRVSDALSALAEQRDDDLLRVGAAMTAGYGLFQRGRFRAAADAFAQAGPLLPGVRVPPMVFAPHPAVAAPSWQATCLLVLGDRPGADELYARVRDRRDLLDDPITASYLDVIDLYRWVFEDRPDRALDAGATAARSVERTGLTVLRTLMGVPFAWARSHRDPRDGAAASRAAIVAVDEPDGMAWRPFLCGLHADVLLRAGDTGEALARVDATLDETARTGATFWDAELHRLRAAALTARGAPDDEVGAALDRAREIATTQGARLFLNRLPP